MLKHTSEEHIKFHQDLTLEKFCHMLGKAEYERDFARRALTQSGKKDLTKDIKEWKRRCTKLEDERRCYKHDFSGYKEHTEEIISRYKETNSELKNCIDSLVSTVEAAIKAGDWKVDGACDPDIDLVRAKQLLKDK